MASFTDEEIQAAVEALVSNTIRRPYDTLGVRRTDLSFLDIQEAAAGVFLLYPKAPFYCLYLGVQAVLRDIESEAQTISLLLEAIAGSGRAVLPVEDITPLFNAKAALESLGQAAISRSTGFKDISTIPAYQRFTSNVDRFLDTSGQAIKDGSNVVRTPQEAKRDMPALLSQLKAQHEELVARVELLSNGAVDYAGLNLSSLVAQSVISKAATVLGQHANALAAMLPEKRLENIRKVVLDVIAAKSVVTTYGSFAGATSTYGLTGTGAPYSDATHLADPARLRSNLSGPYNLQIGSNILDLFLDGAGATPRTLTAALSVADGGNNKATIGVTAIPLDVLVGDVVYFRSGSQLGSKWVITSLVGATITAQGTVPASAAGATTLEILPQPTATIGLPYAFSPQLLGIKQEIVYSTGNGWIIGDGVNPVRPTGYAAPNNNELIVTINGVSFPVTLTLSLDGDAVTEATPRTAEQICTDVNAVINPEGYTMEPYLNPRRYLGYVVQSIDAGTSAHFDLLGGFGNFGSLGITIGDLVNVLDGDSGQRGIWTITAVSATRVTATNLLATPAIDQSQITIEIGSPLRALRIRALDPGDAVDNLETLGVTYVGEQNEESFQGASTLGFTPGAVSRARKQTAKEIASAIASSSSLVGAEAVMVPSLEGVAARTEPTASARVTFSKLRGTASTVWAGPTLTATISGAVEAGVVVGDRLVERGGNNIGTLYAVTGVSSTSITATNISGTPSSQSNVTIEVGRNPALNPYDLLRIEEGPCEGDYYVDSVSGIDVTLLSTLPIMADPITGLSIPLSVSVGPEYVDVSSKNTTTLSKVKARGNAELKFFSHTNGQAGTTKYFRLPAKVSGLGPDDLLLLFATQYNSPSSTFVIEAVEDQILTLDDSLASDVSWAFSPTATVPFAQLQSGYTFDYDAFKTLLDEWLESSVQDPAFFTDLNRFINPLIANATPTGVAIGDAQNRVQELVRELTISGAEAYNFSGDPLEAKLGTYVVKKLPPVEALIRAFKEKGADRAVDLLLSGQFQAFFSLDQDSSSYAGQMQKAMREVVRNDLPIRKENRKDTRTSRLLSTTQDPDPEYNIDDAENATPDPVGQGEF